MRMDESCDDGISSSAVEVNDLHGLKLTAVEPKSEAKQEAFLIA